VVRAALVEKTRDSFVPAFSRHTFSKIQVFPNGLFAQKLRLITIAKKRVGKKWYLIFMVVLSNVVNVQ
jgi:hypothetical protein